MKKSAILKLTALIVLLLALIAVALTVAFYRPVTMKDPVKFRVGSYEAAVEIKKGDSGFDELQKTIEKTTFFRWFYGTGSGGRTHTPCGTGT